jgi:hypothetical protein
MAEARSRDRWTHTSTLLAMLANIHRDPKKKSSPYRPADFSPFRPKEKVVRDKVPITALKIFLRQEQVANG